MNDRNKTILAAEGLCVSLGGRQILNDLSFAVSPGLIGLLGRNGAGKTTLIRAILSLSPVAEGNITLTSGGKTLDIPSLNGKERARYLSYAPQDTGSVPHCTVRDFIASGLTHKLGFFGNPGEREYKLAGDAAKFMGVSYLSDRYMDEISGGERRLAYLARAKAQGAVWMILDEPTAGLDFGRQHDFFASLKRYIWETGTGAIVSIHDPLFAASYCDTILILRDGRITAQLDAAAYGFEEKYRTELEALYGKSTFFNGKAWL